MKVAARRQPKGLYVLLFTEMWERMGFYTLVYLLALYLTESLGMTDSEADLLYGTYMSLVFLTAVAGGIIADRLLGFRRAIILGGLIITGGYALLVQGNAIHFALASLVVGSGLFQVNVTSLLALQYGKDDTRRESGFVLYYMGVNAGGFAASLVSGSIASSFGYEWAFALAGACNILAVATFFFGRRLLLDRRIPPGGKPLLRGGASRLTTVVTLIVGLGAAFAVASLLFQRTEIAGVVLVGIGLLTALLFTIEIRREPPAQRRPVFALLILFFFAIVFWAIYEQSGLSMILYMERSVDREVLGETLPATAFESLNPIFILLTAPVFAWAWKWVDDRFAGPAVPLKFAVGLVLLGLAFLVLRLGSVASGPGALAAPGWIVIFFFLLTCGEFCVAPVGMSIVSRLAPARLLGFTMGMWFLAQSLAGYLSGILAKIAAIRSGTTVVATGVIYEGAFSDYGWLALAGAVTLMPLVGSIRRLMTQPSTTGSNDTASRIGEAVCRLPGSRTPNSGR